MLHLLNYCFFRANNTEYGLASGVFTRDIDKETADIFNFMHICI